MKLNSKCMGRVPTYVSKTLFEISGYYTFCSNLLKKVSDLSECKGYLLNTCQTNSSESIVSSYVSSIEQLGFNSMQ